MIPPVVTSGRGESSSWGFVSCAWKGGHPPRHVHVYRDGTLVVKWSLDDRVPMKGAATGRVLRLIEELEAEGLL